jgi:hypothetical protein
MARRSKGTIIMRTLQSYQQEDIENYGNPWDDEPEAPKVVKGDATEKQINFLVKLMDERGLSHTPELLDQLSKRDASALISTLLDNPKPKVPAKPTGGKTTAPAPAEITEGMYITPAGTIYKVQRAVHGSGHLYAKVLETSDGDAWFSYAAGAICKLRPEWRMTHEQAAEFGSLYGICCCCSKTLTDENSQHNGYGRKCASNNGWPYDPAPKIKR